MKVRIYILIICCVGVFLAGCATVKPVPEKQETEWIDAGEEPTFFETLPSGEKKYIEGKAKR